LAAKFPSSHKCLMSGCDSHMKDEVQLAAKFYGSLDLNFTLNLCITRVKIGRCSLDFSSVRLGAVNVGDDIGAVQHAVSQQGPCALRVPSRRKLEQAFSCSTSIKFYLGHKHSSRALGR
jgi:hypothetical protein